ncbi:MAG: PAS domain S-box protein [Nitrospirae bacterium]|nr:MAG: PAS domain S-box protein [Nitrospirota bacterium]
MAEDALTSRIRALIFFRALFVTLLLGSAFLFRIDFFYSNPVIISSFIVVLYLLTIIYALIVVRVKNQVIFGYAQLSLDVFAEIVLIYITGGIDSWFSFMLLLTILSSSIVLGKKAGFIIATIASLCYGMMLELQFYRVLPMPFDTQIVEKGLFYNIFLHIVSFYLTAFLAGYLSHRLEKTEQKLEEQDAQLKDLELFNIKVIESLPSGLFTTDMDGRVLIFNRAAEKIVGTPMETVIGSSIRSVMPFIPFPFSRGRHEEVIISERGETRIIGLNVSVLRDTSGKDTGFIGVFQDLTQLKKLESEIKQKEKWAAIGELSSNIAHEIRNPLASMKGSIEMLLDEKIPAKHREKLMDIALKEMDRLNHIVTDFLTYSSPKPLEKRRVDLHLLLDETLSLLRNAVSGKETIRIRKAFDGELYAMTDPQKIRQVFWNLGMNAIEAMQDGGELRVATEVTPGTVTISFEDTGAGITAPDLERIFFPFFTTKDKGTGLGLSIAYRIIEEHGGQLTAVSHPGIKTIFKIILKQGDGQ